MKIRGEQFADNTIKQNNINTPIGSVISDNNVTNKKYVDDITNEKLDRIYYSLLNNYSEANNTTTSGQTASPVYIIEYPISTVRVKLNGQEINVGGKTAPYDCYFSDDGGLTVKQPGSERKGDYLYWNKLLFDLDDTDVFNFIFLVKYERQLIYSGDTATFDYEFTDTVIEFVGTSGNTATVDLSGETYTIGINTSGNFVWDIGGINREFTTRSDYVIIEVDGLDYKIIYDGNGDKIFSIDIQQYFPFATYNSITQSGSINTDITFSGDMSINWGDGNIITYVGNSPSFIEINYTYTNSQINEIKFIGNYKNIEYMNVSSNYFSGDITDWTVLTKLNNLLCHNNNFTGDLGIWSNFDHLTRLLCYNNLELTGDLSTWSSLTGMTNYSCQNNNFYGDISTWSTWKKCTQLSCDDNNFSGDLSTWSGLTNLTILTCKNNNFYGNISTWSNLGKLTRIICASNNFSGDTSSWGNLTGLTYLDCYSNNLSGDITSWSGLTQLTSLRCYSNNFTGDASTWKTINIGAASIMIATNNNLSFNSSSPWTGRNFHFYFANNNFTSTDVDNALIALAGGSFTNKSINLGGTNATRTSASDAAIATLLASGNTLDIT